MNRVSKLEALTPGEAPVNSKSSSSPPTVWRQVSPRTPSQKANNLYEGTDSEDEGLTMMPLVKGELTKAAVAFAFQGNSNSVDATIKFKFDLVQGQLAPEGVRFMTFRTLLKYPYLFIGGGNSERVVQSFFNQNQSYDHTFDLFYIYPSESDSAVQAVILIPTKQFEAFLAAINEKLNTNLRIPNGSAGDSFYVGFMRDGNPQARYLGQTSSKETFDLLKLNVPPYYHKMEGEPAGAGTPSQRSGAAFKENISLVTAYDRGKKATSKHKKMEHQTQRHELLGSSVKRVQRYLGIREVRDLTAAIQERLLRPSSTEWYDLKTATKAVTQEDVAKNGAATYFHAQKAMRFKPEDSVIFISIDVEADEFNHRNITEIGVATLDTLDLVNLIPGDLGKYWMKEIRARHFRISEQRHVVNGVHVSGCPDGFEFGDSEFISIKAAPSVIASCFKHPFSRRGGALADDSFEKRNIVLVGHDIAADIKFLKDMGYDVTNLSNLKDTIDTRDVWKYVKNAINPANLGAVLQELGITAWNLHNAGNDSVYTMQAMIGLAIKHLVDKNKPTFVLGKERFAGRVPQDCTDSSEKGLGWGNDRCEDDIAPPQWQAPQQGPGLPGPQAQQDSGTQLFDGDDDLDLDDRFDPLVYDPIVSKVDTSSRIAAIPQHDEDLFDFDDRFGPFIHEPTVPKVATSSPAIATSQHERTKENVKPGEEILVMTEEEVSDMTFSHPWGNESDLLAKLSKIKLVPGPRQ